MLAPGKNLITATFPKRAPGPLGSRPPLQETCSVLCDRCAQRQATRVIAHPQMGYAMPLRLCDVCAQDLPIASDPMTTALTMFQVQLPALQTCPRCQVAFQSICHSTTLGCSYCYTFYRSHLEALLQRVQGSDVHRGKVPLRKGKGERQRQVISELKERLQQAIEAERYEEAAQIRDKIQELSAE